jgi:purine-binding chemotaxis protein CheW
MDYRCIRKRKYMKILLMVGSTVSGKEEDCVMSPEAVNETGQYLTYKLEDEIFALDIGKVREVLDHTSVTKVPQTPDFMRGVINLRGSVVPVMDLRIKFGMEPTQDTVNTCIIITEIELDGEITVLGALADSVQEVIDLEPEQIEPAPKIGTKLRTDFISGMGKHNEQFIILLDIDKVFSCEDISAVVNVDSESFTVPA